MSKRRRSVARGLAFEASKDSVDCFRALGQQPRCVIEGCDDEPGKFFPGDHGPIQSTVLDGSDYLCRRHYEIVDDTWRARVRQQIIDDVDGWQDLVRYRWGEFSLSHPFVKEALEARAEATRKKE